ncbi:MAG: hypothetical protein WCI95_02410 [bacterium]
MPPQPLPLFSLLPLSIPVCSIRSISILFNFPFKRTSVSVTQFYHGEEAEHPVSGLFDVDGVFRVGDCHGLIITNGKVGMFQNQNQL